MGKGNKRTLDRSALYGGSLRCEKIPFNVLVDLTDGNPGVGTKVLRKLKQGNLMFFGALCYVTFTKVSGGITDTFDGDFSIGTTADANAALSGADADIIISTAMGAATAGVSPRIRGLTIANGTIPAIQIYDNTAADLELNLNILIDDAAINAAAVLRAKGTLFLASLKMGDD